MDEVAMKNELNTALSELSSLNKSIQQESDTDLQKYNQPHSLSGSSIHQKRHHTLSLTNLPSYMNLNSVNYPATQCPKVTMQLNPRYISKVRPSIYSSPRKLPDTPLRMRPYFIPERSRTKSENADPSNSIYQETMTIIADSLNASNISNNTINYVHQGGSTTGGNSMMDVTFDNQQNPNQSGVMETNTDMKNMKIKKINVLKKSKSLEDVRAENLDGSQLSHEMEFVSSRIQKLKVQE